MLKCKHCGQTFSNKYNLQSHRQNAKYCLQIQKLQKTISKLKRELKFLRTENEINITQISHLKNERVYQHLLPFDMTSSETEQKLLDGIQAELNEQSIKYGYKIVVSILYDHVIKGQCQRDYYGITDNSRYIGVYIDGSNNIVRDPKFKGLMRWAIPFFEEASKTIFEQSGQPMYESNKMSPIYAGYHEIQSILNYSSKFRIALESRLTDI